MRVKPISVEDETSAGAVIRALALAEKYEFAPVTYQVLTTDLDLEIDL